jgi:hypothetical protein
VRAEIGGDVTVGRHDPPNIGRAQHHPSASRVRFVPGKVDAKTLRRSFGELRGLPYYCSTAGEPPQVGEGL